ncbi:MAG: AI-2E family transporter [Planctomycetota bacterium]|nr:AI-2E family transporter [Planctomycetota bacterium]
MESPSAPSSRSTTADASLVVIAVVVAGAAITHLGPVLQPFLVALFLFYATRFGVKTLSGLGMRPLTAYVTLVGLILIASVLLAQFVYREAVSFRGSWPRYEDRIGDIITAWSGPLGGAAGAGEHVPIDAGAIEPSAARTSLSDLFRVSSRDVLNFVFAKGIDAAELIVLVFCYLVFLFLGSRKFEARVGRAFPGERGKRILAVGEGISESMERFMMVKSVVGVGMGLSAGLIMWLFGLDHWPLWAFLFFAANYITSIGSWAACVAPILIAALDLGGVPATILALLIVVNRIFWIDFLELKLSGKQLNLDPTILFLWLSYWGWAWGILGLILAYPMMAAVKISLRHLSDSHGWDELLSDE